MAYDENTSRDIAREAAELMRHSDPKVRRVAASALTQVLDRLEPEVKLCLDELVAIYQPGAHRPYHNGHYKIALLLAVKAAYQAGREAEVAKPPTLAEVLAEPPLITSLRNALTGGGRR